MTRLVPVDPFDLIIFGGSGDLALRKLLPSLFHRFLDGQIPPDSRIIAVSRSAMERSEYLTLVAEALAVGCGAGALDPDAWQRFAAQIDYLELDALNCATWTPLAHLLDGNEEKNRCVYMATPPELYGPVASGFKSTGLITDNMRLVLEKPVGCDHASACAINDEVGSCFAENQIFRIDHYLGKETVQNLMVLRFANSLFEPLWRREVIDHVQITVAEEIGVGNRIEFYDGIGAMRDMVQNHLLQLLCLVAMEPPASLEDDAVRNEKIKVLRALKPIGRDAVKTHTVRAQYSGGAVGDQVVPGYIYELGSPTETETFVALKAELDNWRWSGVPFYLRTGKRLRVKHSEITIQFKPVPHAIFPQGAYQTLPNRLSIMLQPDEGVRLRVMAKEPGPGAFELQPVSLNLSFEETFGVRYRDAYERLLIEVLRGNPTLFMRRDEVEAAWLWVDGVISGWEQAGQLLETYPAGSWGPTMSTLLLERDGRVWQEME